MRWRKRAAALLREDAARAYLRWLPAFGLALAGCTQGSVELTMRTWWQAASEEAALRGIQNQFKQSHPGATFRDERASNMTTRYDVAQELMNNSAPDTFEVNLGANLLQWARVKTNDGIESKKLVDVAGLFQEEHLEGNLVSDIGDHLGKTSGERFGVPLDVHRVNLVFSKKAADAPSIDQLCPQAGDKPLARIGCPDPLDPPPPPQDAAHCAAGDRKRLALGVSEDWLIVELVLESILPAVVGANTYNALFQPGGTQTGLHEANWNRDSYESAILPALTCAQTLMDRFDIVSVAKRETMPAWGAALEAVATCNADFTIAGDWAEGEILYQPNWQPLVQREFFEPGAPSSPIFVYTSDVFPLPVQAEHPVEAEDLLRMLASSSVQTAFSRAKGSMPAIRVPNGSDYFGRQQAFSSDSTRRLLATSGLLPRNYPVQVNQTLRDLICGRAKAGDAAKPEDPAVIMKSAVDVLWTGFAVLKAWQRELHGELQQ
jgi:ABC-type glycerol-3-phosphate transport system substrate-binding protein